MVQGNERPLPALVIYHSSQSILGDERPLPALVNAAAAGAAGADRSYYNGGAAVGTEGTESGGARCRLLLPLLEY